MKKITEELRKRKPKIAFLLLTEAVLIGVILYYLFFVSLPPVALLSDSSRAPIDIPFL